MINQNVENVLRHLPSVAGYWDTKLLNQYANPAHQAWLELPPEQLLNQNLYEVIPEFRLPAPRRAIEAALTGQPAQFECHFQRQGWEGQRLAQVRCIPHMDEGQVRGLYVLITDIGEWQRTRVELHEAQRIGKMGSWHWYACDGSLHWSPQLYMLLGWPLDQPPPGLARLARHLGPECRKALHQLLREVVHSRQPMIGEARCDTMPGRPVWFVARVQPIFDATGRLQAISGTVQDVSEQKRTESELIESRNRLRCMVAHHEVACEEERKHIAREVHDELGQLLSAMRMDLTVLTQQGSPGPRALQLIDDMGHLLDRMFAVTRGIVTSLRPAALDAGLLPALEWLAQDFHQRCGIQCVVDAQLHGHTIRDALSSMVFRVIQESLTNVVRHARASRVVIQLEQKGPNLSVRIADNGQGFDSHADQQHTGYGLLSIRERALSLGGSSWVESTPGQGTTIWLEVPL